LESVIVSLRVTPIVYFTGIKIPIKYKMEYIYEARDVVPKELCQQIIEKFEKDPDKQPGRMGGGYDITLKIQLTWLCVTINPNGSQP